MHTRSQPLSDPSDKPHAVNCRGNEPLRALIPVSRLTPGLRKVLQGLGARIGPFEWPGSVHPELACITVASTVADGQWLDEVAAESLMWTLQEMERNGRAPPWAQMMLVRHRAGTLLDRDGTLALADGLTAQGLTAAILRLPGH